jgi:hypothetical protein
MEKSGATRKALRTNQKDISTVNQHSERLMKWVDIAEEDASDVECGQE